MSIATRHKLITAEEYLEMPDPQDGSKRELVQGVIVPIAQPGFEHGEVQGNSYFLLKLYAREHQSGRVVVESGVITETDPDTVRGPDVSYYSLLKIPKDQRLTGYPASCPDLLVEVLSPGNRERNPPQDRGVFRQGRPHGMGH